MITSPLPDSLRCKPYRYPEQAETISLNTIKGEILTAVDGEGQQCMAAPACTASTELVAKGSLEISALTKVMFLKRKRKTQKTKLIMH